MEQKFNSVGRQFRWLGVIVFLIGVFMAMLEAEGGVVIIALGLVTAVQGSIIEYFFRT